MKKRIYSSLLPLITLVVTVASLYNLVLNGFTFIWLGTFLSSFPILAYFSSLFITSQPRTSRLLPGYTIPVALGTIITFISFFTTTPTNLTPLILTIISALNWVIYLFWYSIFDTPPTEKLVVGKTLPTFAAQNVDRQPVNSTSLRGKYHIIVFYRGNWCPFCMAQIDELSQAYDTLTQRNAELILISPQPHTYSQKLATKYDLKLRFWIDTDNKVAQQLNIDDADSVPFGLEYSGYSTETVLPTTIITNPDGKMIYIDLPVTYRDRPEVKTFLQILDEAIAQTA
ncbi:MAG TPA: peroxiredoxin family protein [Anaerolineae bacterium]|nr:peroxiredoxin family protein [Anaerolineae bacterium]